MGLATKFNHSPQIENSGKSVTVKTTRKIGLFTSIAIMIGSIIGIGIFFKNNSVFVANGYNGTNVLIAWILSAIISTATALSFAESSSSVHGSGGIGDWSIALCGKKIGYFTKVNLPLFYFGLLITSVGIFTAEAILNIFAVKIHMSYVMLIGLGILFLFVLFNIFFVKASQFTQVVLSSLKFVPILLIIVLGFIFLDKGNNLFKPISENDTIKQENNGFAGILASLPAILFAFDSFTCVGTLGNEVKSKKTIPLAITIGMILVSIVYISITIVQILIGTGTIGGTFDKIFNNNPTAQIVFQYVVSVFIFLSISGVANALTMTCLRSYDVLVTDKVIVGHQYFSKWAKNKPLVAGAILYSFVGGFWWIIMMVLSSIYNHDAFVDGLSNYSTLFFFGIYGLVVLFTFINRFTKKVEVRKLNSFIFYPMAIISIIGIAILVGYQLFYENMALPFIKPNDTISWGVLFGPNNSDKLKTWQGAIMFVTMTIVFITLPIINFYSNKSLTNRIENKSLLVG